jgi:hypothetical protein
MGGSPGFDVLDETSPPGKGIVRNYKALRIIEPIYGLLGTISAQTKCGEQCDRNLKHRKGKNRWKK